MTHASHVVLAVLVVLAYGLPIAIGIEVWRRGGVQLARQAIKEEDEGGDSCTL